MPEVSLDLADAAELAAVLTFLADRLSGSQKQVPARSLATFVDHPAYAPKPSALTCTRFGFLLGTSAVGSTSDLAADTPTSRLDHVLQGLRGWGFAATLKAWVSPRTSCLPIPWSALLTTPAMVS